MKPLRTMATVSAALMLILGACGGGEEAAESTTTTTTKPPPVPAGQWADTVCGDLLAWRDSLLRTAGSLTGSALSGQSLSDVVGAAVGEIKDATTTLVDGLASLGPPQTTDGDKMRDSLTSLVQDLEDTADSVRSSASQISGDQPASQNLSQLATIAKDISDAAAEVESTWQELQGLDPVGQVKEALAQSSECAELAGNTPSSTSTSTSTSTTAPNAT